MCKVHLIIVSRERMREGQSVVEASIILVPECILVVFYIGANSVPANLILLSLLL